MPVARVAAATGSDPLHFILGGGDDHALLACFADAGDVPDGWQVVGERGKELEGDLHGGRLCGKTKAPGL